MAEQEQTEATLEQAHAQVASAEQRYDRAEKALQAAVEEHNDAERALRRCKAALRTANRVEIEKRKADSNG